ncbi:nucleotidyltransferase domain-containing protein [Agilicoccus flavus]|uniref:nucleotidyltransferase domain-containing protein n=1 Tax=Agilicoccus flavus TaxID=2775968 RepID=UPI001CF60D11|nr:nucleotidyltransferase domain-containing protein [Agilicoccus flavus]
MVTVSEALLELHRHRASGRLAETCRRLGIELLVIHGSAPNHPDTAHDIDLAYLPKRDAEPDHLDVVDTLETLVPGDHLDVMPLRQADPVATYAALGRGDALFEAHPGIHAERRIRAFGEYRDTQKFRDLALSLVGR